MRIFFLALLGFVYTSASAQNEQEVSTEISAVTVFEQGAQITRKGNTSLSEGYSEVVFTDIPQGLDERTLRFSTDGDLNVISVNYEVRFDESSSAEKAQQEKLNQQLRSLTEAVRSKTDLLAVRETEKAVLLNNTEFDVWQDMSVTQLGQGVGLVRSRLTEIKQAVQQLEAEIENLNLQRQKVLNDLRENRIERAKPKGTAVVKVSANRQQRAGLELNYLLPEAGWTPFYDFKIEDLDEPMKILYNAKVYQNTGESWDEVKLTLSTGNPGENAELPKLEPWRLNSVSNTYYQTRSPNRSSVMGRGITGIIRGQVLDAATQEAIPFANVAAKNSEGRIISGTTTDIEGSFELKLDQKASQLVISFIGYGTQYRALNSNSVFYTIPLQEKNQQLDEVEITTENDLESLPRASTARMNAEAEARKSSNIRGSRGQGSVTFIDGVKVGSSNSLVSQNPVSLNFDVDIPYTIPSNGEEYRVELEEYNVDANYLYQAVPKLNEHAFLTAQINDWEKLMLMDGEAGIYLEGTYLGQTQLNASTAGDTLEISLGKDQNIAILREKIEERKGTKFFSGKVTKRSHYRILIKNNRDDAITIEVTDQYPVSANENISVERIEHSGGKVDDKSGIISWDLNLEPTEEKQLNLIYEVTYPKGEFINLREKY